MDSNIVKYCQEILLLLLHRPKIKGDYIGSMFL